MIHTEYFAYKVRAKRGASNGTVTDLTLQLPKGGDSRPVDVEWDFVRNGGV